MSPTTLCLFVLIGRPCKPAVCCAGRVASECCAAGEWFVRLTPAVSGPKTIPFNGVIPVGTEGAAITGMRGIEMFVSDVFGVATGTAACRASGPPPSSEMFRSAVL
jgi:hypothetical protein